MVNVRLLVGLHRARLRESISKSLLDCMYMWFGDSGFFLFFLVLSFIAIHMSFHVCTLYIILWTHKQWGMQ